MKKFFLALAFVAASVALYANPICYFTFSQARRTVNFLSTQDELVIYCGYEYELETYVIVSDVWTERINNRYYEVWIYGIDAYTGEEIFMPVDLSCIWLLDRWSNNMYNAARYLHFQCDAPYTTLVWSMPAYHSFTRVAHPVHYRRSYHYDIHRHGWRPMPDAVLPVYYMRPPTAPMPVVVAPYVPGREHPTVQPNNNAAPRTAPTTTRTASTPTRTSTPVPAGNNRQPSTSNYYGGNSGVNTGGQSSTHTGVSDTRTGSTSTRNTTTVTPANNTTSDNTSRNSSSPSRSTTTTTPSRNATTPAATSTSERTTTTAPANRRTTTTTTTTTSNSRNASKPAATTTTRPATNNANASRSTSTSKSASNARTSASTRKGSSNRR